jgi:hypothetical protein
MTANGHREPLAKDPVIVTITADHTGRLDVFAVGPIKGTEGLLYLLRKAIDLAERAAEDESNKEDQ